MYKKQILKLRRIIKAAEEEGNLDVSRKFFKDLRKLTLTTAHS
jgi:hypothetical protein